MTTSVAAKPTSPARRWQIVLARDPRFDMSFVYAVRSTRIFCRPTCPSKRPRRNQVVFFDAPALAREAGFRACRRCHPDQTARTDALAAVVERACRLIEQHGDTPFALGTLARQCGTSPDRLLRAFRRVTGVTPRQYGDERRVTKLKQHLKEKRGVNPALYQAGYGSPSRIYERAAAQLGMTPASYGRGGRGAVIHYAIVACPLGRLLVARTERGVCRISIGSDDQVLERDLMHEFPNAHITHDAKQLTATLDVLAAFWTGGGKIDLPLDIRSTAFQREVWELLRKIPRGTTRSYSAIARALGRPRGARAVARACASNPAALVVPCHRVVRETGALGGYRWGLDRKQKLLEREGALPVM